MNGDENIILCLTAIFFISNYSDWGVKTAHNLTPFERDDWNALRICL